jgi:hypothetical protein
MTGFELFAILAPGACLAIGLVIGHRGGLREGLSRPPGAPVLRKVVEHQITITLPTGEAATFRAWDQDEGVVHKAITQLHEALEAGGARPRTSTATTTERKEK